MLPSVWIAVCAVAEKAQPKRERHPDRAGLYFAILMRKAFPDSEIRVVERNRADDTFGWGVVFSDETLGVFEEADAESYAEITAAFKYWRDIETYHRGECVVSTGHGLNTAAILRRFGANLRRIRLDRKLTQEALAEKAGCQTKIVSICAALRCEVQDLTGGPQKARS